jgi:hypothetical protein
MAQLGRLVGDTARAERYAAIAANATRGFHHAFWNPTLKAYGGDAGATQTLTTPALSIGSPPAELMSTVVATLATDLQSVTGYKPYVGAVTSKILLDVLSNNGLHETALKTATSTEEPSWGYWWTQNSTTCWESWPIGHGTRTHIFLCGGAGEWMWKHVVGITPATTPTSSLSYAASEHQHKQHKHQQPKRVSERSESFSKVSVAPKVHPTEGPASASGDYLSAVGMVRSAWTVAKGGASITLKVALPVGCHRGGVVTVPKPFGSGGTVVATAVVKEAGAVVWDGKRLVGSHPGLISAENTPTGVTFEVTNGAFDFEATAAAAGSA